MKEEILEDRCSKLETEEEEISEVKKTEVNAADNAEVNQETEAAART